ncbi:MAG: hypothetical protein ACE366_08745 [Bradymonadia bacterium]
MMKDVTLYTRAYDGGLNAGRISETLQQAILTTLKAHYIYRGDFEDAQETLDDYFEDSNIADMDYDTMSFEDLDDPAIAYMMDPEADFLSYVEITHEDGEILYAVVANGSNPMGIVLSSSGELAYRIDDNTVSEPDDAAEEKPALYAAIHVVIFHAEEGQSVISLKESLKAEEETESLYEAIFE